MQLIGLLFLSLLVKFAHPIDVAPEDYCILAANDLVEMANDIIADFISGVPDPFDLPFPIDSKKMNLTIGFFNLSNIGLTGLSKISSTKNNYADNSYQLRVMFKRELAMHLDYDMDLKLFNILRLFGTGNLRFSFDDLELEVKLDFDPETHELKDLNLALRVESFQFQVTGLNHNEEISKLVSEDMRELVMEFFESTLFNDLLAPSLLELLQTFGILCGEKAPIAAQERFKYLT